MKKSNRQFISVIITAILLIVVGCRQIWQFDDTPVPVDPTVEIDLDNNSNNSLTIEDGKRLVIREGESVDFALELNWSKAPDDPNAVRVTWTPDNNTYIALRDTSSESATIEGLKATSDLPNGYTTVAIEVVGYSVPTILEVKVVPVVKLNTLAITGNHLVVSGQTLDLGVDYTPSDIDGSQFPPIVWVPNSNDVKINSAVYPPAAVFTAKNASSGADTPAGGDYTVTATAQDEQGETDSHKVRVVGVTPINPTIAASSDGVWWANDKELWIYSGKSITLSTPVLDNVTPAANGTAWNLNPAVTGLSFNSATGALSAAAGATGDSSLTYNLNVATFTDSGESAGSVKPLYTEGITILVTDATSTRGTSPAAPSTRSTLQPSPFDPLDMNETMQLGMRLTNATMIERILQMGSTISWTYEIAENPGDYQSTVSSTGFFTAGAVTESVPVKATLVTTPDLGVVFEKIFYVNVEPDVSYVTEVLFAQDWYEVLAGEDVQTAPITVNPLGATDRTYYFQYNDINGLASSVSDITGNVHSIAGNHGIFLLDVIANGAAPGTNVYDTAEVYVRDLVVSGPGIIAENGTATLSARLLPTTPDDATGDVTVQWTSSDPSVATVDQSGKVTPVVPSASPSPAPMAPVTRALGEPKQVTITATIDGGTIVKEWIVTINGIPVTSIEIIDSDGNSVEKVYVSKDQTLVFNSQVAPSDASDKTLVWSHDSPAIATVTAGGSVTGLSAGTTLATAKAHGVVGATTVTDTVAVVVRDFELTAPGGKTAVKMGDTLTLTPRVLPVGEGTASVTAWASDNESAITVANGVLTPVAPGVATITATDATTGLTASYTITVQDLKITNAESTMKVGGADVQLGVTINDEEIDASEVIWSSSSSAVSVTNGLVTAVSAGTAIITAKKGDLEATVTITVSDVYVESLTVTVDKTDIITNGVAQATATLNPATPTNSTITWSSSNPAVATVDSSTGKIKGVAPGFATITATAVGSDPSGSPVTGNVDITVLGIELSASKEWVAVGNSLNYTVKRLPQGATTALDIASGITIGPASAASYVLNGNTITVTGTSPQAEVRLSVHDAASGLSASTDFLVTQLVISGSAGTIKVGDTPATLSANFVPAVDGVTPEIAWESADPTIATVVDGDLTAINAGDTTVTAKDTTLGVEATLAVTVGDVTAQSIAITGGPDYILSGGSAQYSATVSPNNVTLKDLEWSVSAGDSTISIDPANGTLTSSGGTGSYTLTLTVTDKESSETATKTVHVVNLGISGATIVDNGQSTLLTANLKPQDAGLSAKVTWTLDATTAHVNKETDNTGTFVATQRPVTRSVPGPQVVTVTATDDTGLEATYEVTINGVAAQDIQIIDESEAAITELVLNAGGTPVNLDAIITPSNTSNKEVQWSIEDDTVATINATTGLVSPLTPGITNVKVVALGVAAGASKEDVMSLRVRDFSLTANRNWVGVGKSLSVKGVITPSGAGDADTSGWQSDDEDIATVDNAGKVTGASAGEVSISATDATTSLTRSYTIDVIDVIIGEVPSDINVGDEAPTFTAALSTVPSGVTPNYVWTSLHPSIASISTSGVLTPKTKGTATLSVKETNTNLTKTCTITVNDVYVTEITVNANKTVILAGDTARATADLTPNSPTNSAVAWSSSDPAVAKVDATTGKITAVAPGKATITGAASGASSTNPQSDSVEVTVVDLKVTPVVANKQWVLVDDSVEFTVTVLPEVAGLPPNITNAALGLSSVGEVTIEGSKVSVKGVSGKITDLTVYESVTGTNKVVTPFTVTAFGIDNAPSALQVGDTPLTLTASLNPVVAGVTPSLTWTATGNATIDADGSNLKATAAGNAVITVKDTALGLEDTVTIPVKDVEATGITLTTPDYILANGEGGVVTAEVVPANATNRAVTWSIYSIDRASSDVTIDEDNGIITVPSETPYGYVKVAATTTDGTDITVVSDSIPIVNIATTIPALMGAGERISVDAGLLPSSVNDLITPNFFWTFEGHVITEETDPNKPVWTTTGEASFQAKAIANDDPKSYFINVGILEQTTGLEIRRLIVVGGVAVNTVEVHANGTAVGTTPLVVDMGNPVLLATVFDPVSPSNKNVTWSVAEGTIAKMVGNMVVPLAPGDTTITVTAEGSASDAIATDTISIKVRDFELTGPKSWLAVGKNMVLGGNIVPATSGTASVGGWKSLHEEVATVDTDGKVTGVAEGIVLIEGKDATTGLTRTYPITVVDMGITAPPSKINVGQTRTIEAALSSIPTGVTPVFEWSSSDEDVASIDQHSGELTALSSGTATITVTETKTDLSDTFSLTVNDVFVTGLAVTADAKTIVRNGGETTVRATTTPGIPTNNKIAWTSSDPAIATVNSSSGHVIAGSAAGSVTITGKALGADPDKADVVATVTIYVVDLEVTTSKNWVAIDETLEFEVKIVPEAAGETVAISQTSLGDPAAATVAVDGGNKVQVTGKTAKVTSLSITDSTTGLSVSMPLTVTQLSISGVSHGEVLHVGDPAKTLTASLSPEITGVSVTPKWVSSAPSQATIGQSSGVLEAKDAGEVIITVSDADLGVSTTVTVQVADVEVETLTINGPSAINSGAEQLYTAAETPSNVTNKTLEWKVISGGSGAVIIDQNGNLKAADNGKPYTVTIQVEDTISEVKAQKEVHILALEITGAPTTEIKVGDPAIDLLPKIKPGAASESANVTWTIPAGNVVSIDTDNKLTANNAGTVTVTATDATGLTASAEIVVADVKVETLSINGPAYILSGSDNNLFTPVVGPSNVTTQDLEWSVIGGGGTVSITQDGNLVSDGTVNEPYTVTVKVKDTLTNVEASKEVYVVALKITGAPTTEIKVGDAAIDLLPKLVPAEAGATVGAITWSHPSAVSIDTDNKLTANSAGTVTITATDATGLTASAEIVVADVLVEAVTLEGPDFILAGSNANQFTVTTNPANPTNANIKWEVDGAANEAAITQTGVLSHTPPATGGGTSLTATVTVTDTITGKSDSKTIPVVNLAIDGTGAVGDGGQTTLTAKLEPDVSGLGLTANPSWQVSNEHISYVEKVDATTATFFAYEKPVTRAVPSPGLVTITASHSVVDSDGNALGTLQATHDIMINGRAVEGIDILDASDASIETATVHLITGNTLPLKAKITPSHATLQTVTWTSSDPAIATVTANGTVVPVAAGSVTITASANGVETPGTKVDTIQVTVQDLDIGGNATITRGTTTPLAVYLRPSNTEVTADITWSSGDATRVTVEDGTGIATALATGSGSGIVTVTATHSDTGLTATYDITIAEALPESVTITVPAAHTTAAGKHIVPKGQDVQLTAAVLPTYAANRAVTWSIPAAQQTIATVTESGLVKGLSAGSVEITATAKGTPAGETPVVDSVTVYVAELAFEQAPRSWITTDGNYDTTHLAVKVMPEATGLTADMKWAVPNTVAISATGEVSAAVNATPSTVTIMGTDTLTGLKIQHEITLLGLVVSTDDWVAKGQSKDLTLQLLPTTLPAAVAAEITFSPNFTTPDSSNFINVLGNNTDGYTLKGIQRNAEDKTSQIAVVEQTTGMKGTKEVTVVELVKKANAKSWVAIGNTIDLAQYVEILPLSSGVGSDVEWTLDAAYPAIVTVDNGTQVVADETEHGRVKLNGVGQKTGHTLDYTLDVVALEFTNNPSVLTVNDGAQMEVRIVPASAQLSLVDTWEKTSGADSVLTITEDGTITTGASSGIAKVRVTDTTTALSLDHEIKVVNFSIQKNSGATDGKLYVNGTDSVEYTVVLNPADALTGGVGGLNLQWSSDPIGHVSIEQTTAGDWSTVTVKPIAPYNNVEGITIHAEDIATGLFAEVKLPVVGLRVKENQPVWVGKGKQADVAVELVPNDGAISPTYTWTISDKPTDSSASAVAMGSTSGKGSISGGDTPGPITVTVTTDTNLKVTHNMTVVDLVIVEGSAITTPITVSSANPRTIQLHAQITPAIADETTITWELEPPYVEIADDTTIDENTGKIAVGTQYGTVKVWAKEETTGLRTSLDLTVVDFVLESAERFLPTGNTMALTPKVRPEGAPDFTLSSVNWTKVGEDGSATNLVNWEGSNTDSAATIKAGNTPGKVTIVAVDSNGLVAQHDITVTTLRMVESSPSWVSVHKTFTKELQAELLPAGVSGDASAPVPTPQYTWEIAEEGDAAGGNFTGEATIVGGNKIKGDSYGKVKVKVTETETGLSVFHEMYAVEMVLEGDKPLYLTTDGKSDWTNIQPVILPIEAGVTMDITWTDQTGNSALFDPDVGAIQGKMPMESVSIIAKDNTTKTTDTYTFAVVGYEIVETGPTWVQYNGHAKTFTGRYLPEGIDLTALGITPNIAWTDNSTLATSAKATDYTGTVTSAVVGKKPVYEDITGDVILTSTDKTTGMSATHNVVVGALVTEGIEQASRNTDVDISLTRYPLSYGEPENSEWLPKDDTHVSVESVAGGTASNKGTTAVARTLAYRAEELAAADIDSLDPDDKWILPPGDITVNDLSTGLTTTHGVVVSPDFMIIETKGGTNLNIPVPNTTDILVDWDGDGFFHRGAGPSYDQDNYSGGTVYITQLADRIDLTSWHYNSNEGADMRQSLVDVLQWGHADFTGAQEAFRNYDVLKTFSATDSPILGGSLQRMFRDTDIFDGLGLQYWDVSDVTRMYEMFYNADGLKGLYQGEDAEGTVVTKNVFTGWDVRQVENAESMFRETAKYTGNYMSDLNWESLTNGRFMFYNADGVIGKEMNNWNIPDVVNISQLFYNADNYTGEGSSNWTIAISSSNTNSGLYQMFYGTQMVGKNMKNWNITVNDTDYMYQLFEYMFSGRRSSITGEGMSGWTITTTGGTYGTNGYHMFRGFSSLTGKGMSDWTFPAMTNARYLFLDLDALVGEGMTGWSFPEVTDAYGLFQNSDNFDGDISGWSFPKAGNTTHMFTNTSFTGEGVSNVDFSAATNVTNMFYGSKFTGKNAKNWNFDSLASISELSEDWRNPTGYMNNANFTGEGMSGWSFASLTSANNLFLNCPTLTGVGMTDWNMPLVTSAVGMFSGAAQFTGEGMTGWNLPKVDNLTQAFRDTQFNGPITSWNIGSSSGADFTGVTVNNLFIGSKINQDLSSWDWSGATTDSLVFSGTPMEDETDWHPTGY